jgi:hypothetical protein
LGERTLKSKKSKKSKNFEDKEDKEDKEDNLYQQRIFEDLSPAGGGRGWTSNEESNFKK